MSVGSVGIVGSPLAQAKGSESSRAVQESNAAQRTAAMDAKAESAAGVGPLDGEDTTASDHAAGGRAGWDFSEGSASEHRHAEPPCPAPPDPNGESGGELDLTG